MTKQKGTGSTKFAAPERQIFLMDDSETDIFFPLLAPPLPFLFPRSWGHDGLQIMGSMGYYA